MALKHEQAFALFLAGKSHAEIAFIIGTSISSVAGLLFYARSKAHAVKPVKNGPGSAAWWKPRGY